MAADLERQGNAKYVDEEFDEALDCYTKGLELEPDNASLYSSRAAAHLKLENFLGASVVNLCACVSFVCFCPRSGRKESMLEIAALHNSR